MRGALAAAGLIALTVSASAQSPASSTTLDQELARAQEEVRQAEAETRKLEALAAKSREQANRAQIEQVAAAQAIAAAEAQITASDISARLAAARLSLQRERLAKAQAPLTSLVGGLALMARRPPLLFIAERGAADDFVRAKVLLDATLPTLRARTASVSGELERLKQLEQSALETKAALAQSNRALEKRKRAFETLEAQSLAAAEANGTAAFNAGEQVLAGSDQLAALRSDAQRQRTADRAWRDLAALGAPALRTGTTEAEKPALDYALPADAPVVEGMAETSPNGVRARGVTLATGRGAPVSAPAAGTIRFAGPFRSYDGVVIIDHGRGWMSLIVNAASTLPTGSKIAKGQRIGRALGRISVELSRNGRHWSPALIAGSSQRLSKSNKDS